MTTYPWGTWAAGWGTSFSAPLVSGTAALMLGANGNCTSSNVASGCRTPFPSPIRNWDTDGSTHTWQFSPATDRERTCEDCDHGGNQ